MAKRDEARAPAPVISFLLQPLGRLLSTTWKHETPSSCLMISSGRFFSLFTFFPLSFLHYADNCTFSLVIFTPFGCSRIYVYASFCLVYAQAKVIRLPPRGYRTIPRVLTCIYMHGRREWRVSFYRCIYLPGLSRLAVISPATNRRAFHSLQYYIYVCLYGEYVCVCLCMSVPSHLPLSGWPLGSKETVSVRLWQWRSAERSCSELLSCLFFFCSCSCSSSFFLFLPVWICAASWHSQALLLRANKSGWKARDTVCVGRVLYDYLSDASCCLALSNLFSIQVHDQRQDANPPL